MVEFDERFHLHVGYYENNYELEAIFLKQQDQDVWYLFFENEVYHLKLPKEEYSESTDFGTLIGKYTVTEDDMTFEFGSLLFKQFLNEVIFKNQ